MLLANRLFGLRCHRERTDPLVAIRRVLALLLSGLLSLSPADDAMEAPGIRGSR